MLAHGINVNHVFKESGHRRHSQTPIFIAVSRNYRDLVHMLVNAGCDLEWTDNQGETVLFLAIKQGKMPMIRLLLSSGANVSHLNKKGENALFSAVRWGRRDIVEFLLSSGIDVNAVNKDGVSPLLLGLELYDNACSLRHATRRSAPSSVEDIICMLIPLCMDLNHQHPYRGSALRIALGVETRHYPNNLKVSKLLMQHGAIPDRLFFLRFGGLSASTSKPGSEFFTEHFFNMALAAGANLQREKTWLLTVLTEMPEELQPYERLFEDLLVKALEPASLQNMCLMFIRRQLNGQLWKNIDTLPLPETIKDCLKLNKL